MKVAGKQKKRTAAPAPNNQRRQAKRRQAVSRRWRRFETTLAGFNLPTIRLQTPELSLSLLGFSGWYWSKLLSLVGVVAMCALLAWIHSDSRWFIYRENVTVSGASLLSADDLYSLGGADGWNLLWLRKEDLQAKLLFHPWLTDAQVQLQLPPQVNVQVSEAQPIAVWMTDQGNFWVAPNGATMPAQADRLIGLPRIVDPERAAQAIGSPIENAVDTGVVQSALALIDLMPGLNEVRFSPEVGLNFGLPNGGVWVYWGDGNKVDQKLESIALGQKLMANGTVKGAVVDVRFPGKPVIR